MRLIWILKSMNISPKKMKLVIYRCFLKSIKFIKIHKWWKTTTLFILCLVIWKRFSLILAILFGFRIIYMKTNSMYFIIFEKLFYYFENFQFRLLVKIYHFVEIMDFKAVFFCVMFCDFNVTKYNVVIF